MERNYRPVDRAAEGFAWCHTCEGQSEDDAAYISQIDNVTLALKDCNTPDSLDARLRVLAAAATSNSNAVAGASAMDVDAHTPVGELRSAQVKSEPQGAEQTGVVGLAAVVQEVWRTRHEWGPAGLSGLTGRDDQEDAALWCALVTQRANEQYGHRATADKPEPDQSSSKGQGLHELEVFECLSRLCGAGAGDPDAAQQQQPQAARSSSGPERNRGTGPSNGQRDPIMHTADTGSSLQLSRKTTPQLQEQARDAARRANEAPAPRPSSKQIAGAVSVSGASDEAMTGPVVLEASPNGECTLAFPVLGIGYFGWVVGDAVRVLLACVAACLRDSRAPKLRLVLVVPQAAADTSGSTVGDEVMAAVETERARSASVAGLDKRFEVRTLARSQPSVRLSHAFDHVVLSSMTCAVVSSADCPW